MHASTSERPALTGDMLLLLKSQDKAYIQTKKNSEDKVRGASLSCLPILTRIVMRTCIVTVMLHDMNVFTRSA